MTELEFSNSTGHRCFFSDDAERFYAYDGTPAGFVSETRVCRCSGKQVGWLIDGWIIDQAGDCVLWETHCSGAGPAHVPVQSLIVKAEKQPWPDQGSPKDLLAGPPAIQKSWSRSPAGDLFGIT